MSSQRVNKSTSQRINGSNKLIIPRGLDSVRLAVDVQLLVNVLDVAFDRFQIDEQLVARHLLRLEITKTYKTSLPRF